MQISNSLIQGRCIIRRFLAGRQRVVIIFLGLSFRCLGRYITGIAVIIQLDSVVVPEEPVDFDRVTGLQGGFDRAKVLNSIISLILEELNHCGVMIGHCIDSCNVSLQRFELGGILGLLGKQVQGIGDAVQFRDIFEVIGLEGIKIKPVCGIQIVFKCFKLLHIPINGTEVRIIVSLVIREALGDCIRLGIGINHFNEAGILKQVQGVIPCRR